MCLMLGVLGSLAMGAFPTHNTMRRWCKGDYDLPEIRRLMDFVRSKSAPGDIIFTDDWDVFPVYFYFNDINRYMAGLDPMFSYTRDPELWERYVLITRGQAPLRTTVKVPERQAEGSARMTEREITVPLEDIRDRWGARFIIVDSDHKPFARKLDLAKGLVRRVYPETLEAGTTPKYTVYEVLENAPRDGQSPVTAP